MNNARSRRQRGFRVFDCSTHKSIPAQEDVKMGSEYQAEGALNPVVMVRRSRRLRMRQNGVPAVAPSGGKPVRVPERNVGRNGGRKQRALKAIRKPRVVEEESRNVPKRVTTLPAPPNNTPTIGVQTGCHISDETMTELSAFVTNQLSFHEDDSDANETLADLLPNFDPLVMSPYVIDVLEYYQSNETKSILPDYGDHPPVDPAHRRVLVDWLIDVQNHLCLGQETLHLSVALLDAFLWKRPVSLNDLQLLGVTCLLVACKYEEIYLPDVDTLCALCANAYKPRQILTMERRILRVFRFDLFYPTATGFLDLFLVLTEMQDDEKIVHVCNYLLDLALVDFELQRAPPSKRAAAALFVALRLCEDSCRKRASDHEYDTCDKVLYCRDLVQRTKIMTNQQASDGDDESDSSMWTKRYRLATRYLEAELVGLADKLTFLAQNIQGSISKGAYNKYACKAYLSVSASLEHPTETLTGH